MTGTVMLLASESPTTTNMHTLHAMKHEVAHLGIITPHTGAASFGQIHQHWDERHAIMTMTRQSLHGRHSAR
jgi:hypothetical protein